MLIPIIRNLIIDNIWLLISLFCTKFKMYVDLLVPSVTLHDWLTTLTKNFRIGLSPEPRKTRRMLQRCERTSASRQGPLHDHSVFFFINVKCRWIPCVLLWLERTFVARFQIRGNINVVHRFRNTHYMQCHATVEMCALSRLIFLVSRKDDARLYSWGKCKSVYRY